jgi:hypothetical protein
MAISNTPVGVGRLGVCQTFATSTTSASVANKFGVQTYSLLIVCTVACNIVVGDGTPTATTSSQLLPANALLSVTCSPGQRLAAVSASAGAIFVTEIQ